MIHDQRFIETIKKSGIKQVTLLDDAFDLPALDGGDWGAFLEFLESEAADALLGPLGVELEAKAKAIEQINSEDYVGDALTNLIESLHKQYIESRDGKYDPTGVFKARLSNNLADIDPIIALLRRCKGLELTLLGINTPLPGASAKPPELVFADYYMAEAIQSNSKPSKAERDAAAAVSRTRLAEVLQFAIAANRHPSVILMSSKDVQAKAETYRREVSGKEGRVFASRFGFMMKSNVQILPLADDAPPGKPNPIQVVRPGADVLIEIVQSHPFGTLAP